MRTEPLSMLLTSDLAGKPRGRAVRTVEIADYLRKGCGWVPANMAIDVFGGIVPENPYGPVGDLRIVPDADSRSVFPSQTDDAEVNFYFGNLVDTNGDAWRCCPRTLLQEAVHELEELAGVHVLSSFEHEFMVLGQDRGAASQPFSMQEFLRKEKFGASVMAALQDGGLEPEMWLPEFGRDQWEVTLSPTQPVQAAERAFLLREYVTAVAEHSGLDVTFSPIVEQDGGGNGVHIHLSLQTLSGEPVSYDPAGPGGLSEITGSFAAGILQHARELQLLAASAAVSYERLAPARWSSGGVFLGKNNREALLRICPLYERPGADPHRQFNLEYRAADVTANPFLVLAALIKAGTDGIRRKLPAPTVIDGPVDLTSAERRAQAGVLDVPSSLDEAIDLFTESTELREWFSDEFVDLVTLVKRAESQRVAKLSDDDRYRLYAEVY